MDKSAIVISVNVAYVILFLTILFKRLKQYDDKVWVKVNGEQVPFEYFGYTLAGGLTYVSMLVFPFVRNHHVFEHSIPITFIAQFVVQFIILVLYLIDSKITRYMVSYGMVGFLAFMFLNGLFRMEIESTKLELTTTEVQRISRDLDEFSQDVAKRIQKINNDMNLVLVEIKERQKQIDLVNNLLNEKKKEHESVRAKLEVDREKAETLLKALGVKPPTIIDRLIDGGIGAVLGLFLSLVWNRFFGKGPPIVS